MTTTALILLSTIDYKEPIKQDQTGQPYSITEHTSKPADEQRLKVENIVAIGTSSKDIYILRSSLYPGTFFHASHLLEGATYKVRWNDYGLLSIEITDDADWIIEVPDILDSLEFTLNVTSEL